MRFGYERLGGLVRERMQAERNVSPSPVVT
jgi:hypothetical protein